MAVIAVIFDFDDTLLPDSTSALLDQAGVDPTAFWSGTAKQLYDAGYDQPTAYLNPLLDMVGPGLPLGELTNERLRDFGATLDATWFPGLPGVFDDLRDQIKKAHRDITIASDIELRKEAAF